MISLIFFFVCGGIFFGVFFGVFHKALEFDNFIQVDNCQITGKLSKNLINMEQYSIVYV